MKKIFTLIAAALMAVGANAQTTVNLGGLKVADFTFESSAFEKSSKDIEDEDGNVSTIETITYILKDKENWSELSVTGTPVAFLYKNKDKKSDFYQLYADYICVNGKTSNIKIKDLKAGQAVTLKVAGKGSTAAAFKAFDNCTADENNPESVEKSIIVEEFSEFKFTAEADGDIIIQETAGGFNIANVVIEEATDTPVTPSDPTTATVWDFAAEIGSGDLANMEADTENWKYEEANNRYSNVYVLAKVAEGYNDEAVMANGAELEFTKGLTIGRYNNKLNAGNLRLDNGKGMGLNGSGVVLAIPGLIAGDVVKIRYASTNDEPRGFTVINADITETKLQNVDEKAEETMTVAENGKLILQTTAGLYVYALAVNDELPEMVDTAIKTIAQESNVNGAIFNLAGQQVNKAVKGVYIMNGKKFVVK